MSTQPLWAASTFVTCIPGRILKQPIMVVIQEYPDDDWQILWPEARIYGAGNTMESALDMFRSEVASLTFESLDTQILNDKTLTAVLNFHFQKTQKGFRV